MDFLNVSLSLFYLRSFLVTIQWLRYLKPICTWLIAGLQIQLICVSFDGLFLYVNQYCYLTRIPRIPKRLTQSGNCIRYHRILETIELKIALETFRSLVLLKEIPVNCFIRLTRGILWRNTFTSLRQYNLMHCIKVLIFDIYLILSIIHERMPLTL